MERDRKAGASWEVATPLGPLLWKLPHDCGQAGGTQAQQEGEGHRNGCTPCRPGNLAGLRRPSPAPGAASRHRRADDPAAHQGAGPHLPVRDQGLESSRCEARTCPAMRHRGVLGEGNRKIPTAWGCEEEEGDSRLGAGWGREG